jgi:hypothetical protein
MISMGRTVLIALLVVTGAYCTKSKAADSIVGSWRLVTWVEVERRVNPSTAFSEKPNRTDNVHARRPYVGVYHQPDTEGPGRSESN